MRTILLCSLLISTVSTAQEVETSPLAENYGFLPVEVTRLSPRMSSLHAADLNDDGRLDLLMINNDRNRLEVLIQREKAASSPTNRVALTRNVNHIDSHWRFEARNIPVDQEVVALTTGDFNNDGRTDLAYFGNPDRLIVRFQGHAGQWTSRWETRLPEVAAGAWCVASGDLNGDGRMDLVILGKTDTLLFLQPTVGEFTTPVRLMNTSDQLALVQTADLNDDGLDDVCYLAGPAVNRRLGLRLQTLDGKLGPEYLFDLQRPRAMTVRDVDGDGSAEILTLDSRAGRLKIFKLRQTDLETDEIPDRLVRYGFGQRGTGRDRDLTIIDMDGNGLDDVIVSDPEASRLLLFRQHAERGLDLGTPYPSLTNSGLLKSGRLIPTGPAQLFVLSSSEKAIAQTSWSETRISFPQALLIDLEPIGMELVDLDNSGKLALIVLARRKEGRTSSFQILVLQQKPDGSGWQPDPQYTEKPIDLPSLKGSPDRLMLCNLVNDDRPELLIFQGARPPVVLGANQSDVWEEIPTTGNLGAGSISENAVSAGRIGDHSALFVAQENFVRILKLGSDGRWETVDQVNAGEAQGRIAGSAMLDLDGRAGDELVTIDTGVKKLRILQQVDQRFQPWKEIELGEFQLKTTRIADLNGDSRPDLVLFGNDQFAVLYAGGTTPTLEEAASYESAFDQRYPADLITGDLNGDQQSNIALIDTRNRQIEILEYRPPSQLERALYFTVFDEKGFTRDEAVAGEPREGLIADVTGDGRKDLVLLAHDRILVYPQDPGTAP